MQSLILGSSSPARQQSLKQLNLPFTVCAPHLDETPQQGESALQLVARLAKEKALAVSTTHPMSLILSADQVLEVNNRILGKPHSDEGMRTQLEWCRGQKGTFWSGLCLYNAKTHQLQEAIIPTHITYKNFSDHRLDYYIQFSDAHQCAGGFKSEGLGPLLCDQIESTDPSAILGLPLLTVIQMLEAAQFPLEATIQRSIT